MSIDKLAREGRITPTTNNIIRTKEAEGEIGWLSDKEFSTAIISQLLGEDWYVTDPLSRDQILYEAFIEIVTKYTPNRDRKANKEYMAKYLDCVTTFRKAQTDYKLDITEKEIVYLSNKLANIATEPMEVRKGLTFKILYSDPVYLRVLARNNAECIKKFIKEHEIKTD